MDKKSFCNPLDLGYKFQHFPVKEGAYSCREGADPTLVQFKDHYYLFVSMSAGFWHSADLLNWEYRESKVLPAYDYAPDACPVGEKLYFTASRHGEGNVILVTDDPLADQYEEIPVDFSYWDPAMFRDEDGRTYLYWGCGNTEPLYGVELDPENFKQIGQVYPLIGGDEEHNGFERCGENGIVKREGPLFQLYDLFVDKETGLCHLPEDFPIPDGMTREAMEALIPMAGRPYIEGAFMTKYGDTYYLQYSCPGTEFNIYSNAVYTAKSPLGPFTLQESNPYSSKPGGFIAAAGHGSTMRDRFGNYWQASTMRISVNRSFERRVGLFPAGFDEEGTLLCNQSFGDYPMLIPEGKFDPMSVKPKWMLMSYGKPVTASSTEPGSDPQLAVNENICDWWSAGNCESGEWLCVDLEKAADVRAIQVNLADDKLQVPFPERKYQHDGFELRYIERDEVSAHFTLEVSTDGKTWQTVETIDRECANVYVEIPGGVNCRYVRVTGDSFPYGEPMRISGLRVFGNGSGEKPAQVKADAKRIGPMDAKIIWTKAETAQGYNVRYGLKPDKLYHSWLVYSDCELSLPMLIDGKEYYVCVDSFNENGITTGNVIKIQ